MIDLKKNVNVNCTRVGVVQRTANKNVSMELAPDVSMCSGCAADTSSNCGDAEHPKDFIHLIKGIKGHADCVPLVQE
jgi:hypothetical protein